jgi:hypothetical protein
MSLFCEKHLYEIYVRVGLIKRRYYEKSYNQRGRVCPLLQLRVGYIYATLVQPKCEYSIASRYGEFIFNNLNHDQCKYILSPRIGNLAINFNI